MIKKFFLGFWRRIKQPFRSKKQTSLVPAWERRQPQKPETDFESLVKQGYRRNELIFACIVRTYGTAAQIKLKVRNKSTMEELPDHPLQQLIDTPNQWMNQFDLFAAIHIYQSLGGRALFEIQFNVGGLPIGLHPLRPDHIEIVPGLDKPIGAYKIGKKGIPIATLAPEEVLDVKIFDPLNMYHSWPPVAVAARAGDLDNAITDFYKLMIEEGGIPPGIIKTTLELDEDQVAELRARWQQRYGGIRGWQAPAVLSHDAEYIRTGFTFTELGTEVLDEREETRICMVLRVPPIIVGARAGLQRSTFANYAEARKSWWEDELVPMYVNYLDAFNNQLLPHFGDDNLELFYDFSTVPALREDEMARWERASKGIASGYLTVNEARELTGLEEIPGSGDVFLRSFGSVEVPMTELRTTITPLFGEAEEEEEKIRQIPASVKQHELISDERVQIEDDTKDDLIDFLLAQQKRVDAGLDEFHWFEGGQPEDEDAA